MQSDVQRQTIEASNQTLISIKQNKCQVRMYVAVDVLQNCKHYGILKWAKHLVTKML